MSCWLFRSRQTVAKLIRICAASLAAALIVFLITKGDNGDMRSNVRVRVQGAFSTTRHSNESGLIQENSNSGEEIHMDRIGRSGLDHKDLAGEWFERPMILRDRGLLPLIRTDRSADPDLTFISINYKLGPVFAMTHILQKYGVRVIDKSLSSYCHVTDTCSDLEYPVGSEGLHVTEDDIQNFWRRYRRDPEFVKADGFICIYPASLCELVLPFNKTVILIVDNRYELGKTKTSKWLKWSENFIKIANEKNNIVVATNHYDMEYVKYFTGVELPVVPYACDYVTRTYDPHLPSYLLMPIKKTGFSRMIIERFRAETLANGMHGRLDDVIELYGEGYTTAQISRHAGLVVVPHTVSSLSVTEILRLNIPIYMPTVELLSRWHADSHIMERTLHTHPARGKNSRPPPHNGMNGLPDPNEDGKLWAIGFWMTFCEYFSWPGIKHFDSVEDLALKINETTGHDLYHASHRARVFNEHEQGHVNHFWSTRIHKLAAHKNKYI